MDTIRVSIQFRKFLYTCQCGEELLVDDNTRTYECVKCGFKLGEGWYRDVGDSISMSMDEYTAMKPEDIEVQKAERVDKRIYDIKNPPEYIEPTPEDIQAQIDQKEQEIVSLAQVKVEAQAKLDMKLGKVQTEDLG